MPVGLPAGQILERGRDQRQGRYGRFLRRAGGTGGKGDQQGEGDTGQATHGMAILIRSGGDDRAYRSGRT